MSRDHDTPADGPKTGKESGSYRIAEARRMWCAFVCARATVAAAGAPEVRSWAASVRRRQLSDLALRAAELTACFEAWPTTRTSIAQRGDDSRAYEALVADGAPLGITPY